MTKYILNEIHFCTLRGEIKVILMTKKCISFYYILINKMYHMFGLTQYLYLKQLQTFNTELFAINCLLIIFFFFIIETTVDLDNDLTLA